MTQHHDSPTNNPQPVPEDLRIISDAEANFAQFALTHHTQHTPGDMAFMDALTGPEAALAEYALTAEKSPAQQYCLASDTMPDPVVEALARSPHTHPMVLELLAIGDRPTVRVIVAQNPRTPINALRLLAKVTGHLDGDAAMDAEFVSYLARENLAARLAAWEAQKEREKAIAAETRVDPDSGSWTVGWSWKRNADA